MTNIATDTLEIRAKIGQVHQHIPHSIASLKKANGSKIYSSGFDCVLTTSDLNSQRVEKQTNIGDLLAKKVGIRGPTPPHVYHISAS